MENLSFDEGLKSYKINGDSNRVLRFNPGDINILPRYREVVANLEKSLRVCQKLLLIQMEARQTMWK